MYRISVQNLIMYTSIYSEHPIFEAHNRLLRWIYPKKSLTVNVRYKANYGIEVIHYQFVKKNTDAQSLFGKGIKYQQHAIFFCQFKLALGYLRSSQSYDRRHYRYVQGRLKVPLRTNVFTSALSKLSMVRAVVFVPSIIH